MKIGFFGGCFNPPTIAHINLAKKAIDIYNLDKVMFVPIGDFYKKEGLININYRIDMLELICKNEKNLEVSDLEKNFTNTLYAIDIFEIIEKQYPNDDIYFLIGEDNFVKMPKWKDYNKLKKYNLIVMQRNENIENTIPKDMKVFYMKTDLSKNVASTKVRKNLENNLDIDNMISKEIKEYIRKNSLYKTKEN